MLYVVGDLSKHLKVDLLEKYFSSITYVSNFEELPDDLETIVVVADNFDSFPYVDNRLLLLGIGECIENKKMQTWKCLYIKLETLGINEIENVQRIYDFLVNQRKREQRTVGTLSNALNSLKNEKEKVKKIYDKFKSKSVERYDNLSISTFYKVGLKDGTDYLKHCSKDRTFHLMGINSKSYYHSSMWLASLELFNKNSLINSLSFFNDDFLANVMNSDECEFFFLDLDVQTLSLNVHNFGEFYLLSSSRENIIYPNQIPMDKTFYSRSQRELKLSRGERLLIISPGVSKYLDDQQVKNIINELSEDSWREIPDKIIMELSRQGEYDILNEDLNITLMEVSNHAMVSIT